ncbi:MAG TPA: 5-(carboxyamino)imidazole ribonucleotide mutase [Myxococcaceae bacterium]|nr:5-(carboxyamino)imidazole ribonucleotide mutase [Myxococcaceae bacterium]
MARRPATTPKLKPLVGVIMGSQNDWETLRPAGELLDELGVPYEARVVSAHRTPDWMFRYASAAEGRGLQVIIAGAGGAAHLPGMVASKTGLPVIGVPVPATALQGVDALLSILQMPRGTPVATMAIGKPGAANAALFAAKVLALRDPALAERLRAYKQARADEVMQQELKR